MTRALVAAVLVALSCVPAVAQARRGQAAIIADEADPASAAALEASRDAVVAIRSRVQKRSFVTGERLTRMAYQSLTGPQSPAGPPAARLPATIPLFPLGDIMLFPNAERPLLIFEPRYRAMVADALKGDRIIGMVRLRPGFEADYEGRPPIDTVGCAGVITEAEQLPDGRYTILLRGLTKFRVVQEDAGRPYRLARVDAVPEAGVSAADRAALAIERRQMTDLLALQNVELASDPKDEQAIDTVAQYLEMTSAERQALLEMDGVLVRARALVSKLDGR
jgi:Lon protease-like protein